RGAVELDDQHGAGVERKPEAVGRLDRLDDQTIHHLERGRYDAGGDDAGDRAARALDGVEDGEERAPAFGAADQPGRRTRHDAEGALATYDQSHQVVAGQVLHRTAELYDLAARQDQLDAEDVVGRDPVLERVRAAGVLGDVAADRARGLARRIRRVEQ